MNSIFYDKVPISTDVNVQYYAYYGKGSGPIYLPGVYCRGTESSILDCGYSSNIGAYVGTCDDHNDDVGVVCSCKLLKSVSIQSH